MNELVLKYQGKQEQKKIKLEQKVSIETWRLFLMITSLSNNEEITLAYGVNTCTKNYRILHICIVTFLNYM